MENSTCRVPTPPRRIHGNYEVLQVFMSNIFVGCGRDYGNGNYDTPTLELTFAPFAFTEAALLTGPAVQAICGAVVP